MQTGNLPAGVPAPNETLGYQVIRWAQKYIVQPDGETAGESWKFTPEQLRFVLWFYAIKPDGTWRYSAGTLRRAKGWGKTPLLAALAIVEFIGPCRFSHWDAFGLPVAKRVPLPTVQIGATALDQTDQTLEMIRGMLSESPAEKEFGLDIGKSIIQFKSGKPGSIKPKATAGRTNEGNRPTFVRAPVDSSTGARTVRNLHSWMRSTTGLARMAARTSTRQSSETSRRPLPRALVG